MLKYINVAAYLVNVLLLDTGVLEDLLNRLHGLTEEVQVQLLELRTSKGLGEIVAVLERLDFNAGALLRTESTLRLLNLALQFAHRPEVGGRVGAGLLLVLLDEVVDDTVVEVLTTEMGVTGRGQYLEDALIDREEGDIESSTTEIVDDDLRLAAFLVKAVGDRSGSGLVDDTKDSETSDGAGILSRLTLGVVEV